MLPVHPRAASRWALGLVLSASLLLPAGTTFAQASVEDKAAARALATQGSDALKSSRFAEAIDLVTRAEAIVHAPTHLLMIARAQSGLGKLVAAQETYLKLTREELAAGAPAAFKNAQVSGREELAAIEPKIASLRIVVEGGAQKATVKLDDVIVPPALLGVYRPVDPGHHVVAVFPIGGTPVRSTVDLHEAEKREIKLAAPEGPPPGGVPVNAVDNPDAGKAPPVGPPVVPDQRSPGFFTPVRGAGIGVGAVGVAGVVVGAIFLAQGFSEQSTANANATKLGCTPNCPPGSESAVASQVTPHDQAAARDKTIGGIALPIGVAALGTGVVLLIIGKPKAPAASSAHASVTPWFVGTSGGLRGEF